MSKIWEDTAKELVNKLQLTLQRIVKAGTLETEKSCFYYMDFLVLVQFNNKREKKFIIIKYFSQSSCH